MDKAQTVLDAMKNAKKPMRPGDVAEITGIDKNEISKIISELKKRGLVISPKKCFYSIPE